MIPLDLRRAKTFWQELKENLLHLMGYGHMAISPRWMEDRLEASISNAKRIMGFEAKRKARMKRYELGHYRAVYARQKREERAERVTRAQEQKLWRVYDHDFVGGVQ